MRLGPLVVAAAVGLTVAASALAGWSASGSGDGAAAATSLAAGPTPTATAPALSLTITVSWSATPLATGYVLTRRNGLGVVESPGGTCAGTVAGTSCSETVLAGTHSYAVAPRRAGWSGVAGPESAALTVPQV